MSKASINRRLSELESLDIWKRVVDYPPLTHEEIVEIEQRMRAGGRLSKAELERLEQHSPVIDGELGITCWKGHFRMMRYIGVDLSQV